MNQPAFAFGKNWRKFLRKIYQSRISDSVADMKEIGLRYGVDFPGARCIDIGSGSGLHSVAMMILGAKELVCIDADADSVIATQMMIARGRSEGLFPSYKNDPTVIRGSILSNEDVSSIGKFDFVYSWGVLHHTGDMKKAIENALFLVSDAGVAYFTLY